MKQKQKTMIDKACQWLEEHLFDDRYWTSDRSDIFLGCLIDDFRKAMEE